MKDKSQAKAEWLKQFIASKGLTPTGMEVKVGCARSSISRPLGDGDVPGMKVLAKIKSYYPDLDINVLLSSRDEPRIGHRQGDNGSIIQSPIQIGDSEDGTRELERLRGEVDLLREILKAKDEIIDLLRMRVDELEKKR